MVTECSYRIYTNYSASLRRRKQVKISRGWEDVSCPTLFSRLALIIGVLQKMSFEGRLFNILKIREFK